MVEIGDEAIQEPKTENSELRTPVSVFVREGCSHCRDEEEFLAQLQNERNDFEVFYHDIGDLLHYQNFETLAVLEKIPKTTPITLVGDTIIQGFSSARTTGIRIVELLDSLQGQPTFGFSEFIAAGGSRGKIEMNTAGVCEGGVEICEVPEVPEDRHLVEIPLFGVVDIAKYSLPTISIILGFIDGFSH